MQLWWQVATFQQLQLFSFFMSVILGRKLEMTDRSIIQKCTFRFWYIFLFMYTPVYLAYILLHNGTYACFNISIWSNILRYLKCYISRKLDWFKSHGIIIISSLWVSVPFLLIMARQGKSLALLSFFFHCSNINKALHFV